MKKILRNYEAINFPAPSVADLRDCEYLKKISDNEIDFSDIPEMTGKKTRHYYQISNFVKIDEDILTILKKNNSDYVKKINSILREAVACM